MCSVQIFYYLKNENFATGKLISKDIEVSPLFGHRNLMVSQLEWMGLSQKNVIRCGSYLRRTKWGTEVLTGHLHEVAAE